MKILVAPNSYKESADAHIATKLFSKCLNRTDLEIIEKPISDGGDGFLNVCKDLFQLKKLSYRVSRSYDNYLMPIQIGIIAKDHSIFIESAEMLGLKVIPKEDRKPAVLNSKSLGDLIKILTSKIKNSELNADKIFIGIGGTATNDLGLGACSAFGLKIYDEKNELKIKPINYSRVRNIEWEEQKLPFQLISIIDVDNKLLGKNGATHTFAKQKGASEEEISQMEKGFENIINILIKMGKINSPDILSGAGGGIAAGLSIFLNAKQKTAKDFIINDLGIGKIKSKIEYVITGEGSYDMQSLNGKGCGIILNCFKNSAKKIFLVCGRIDPKVKRKLETNVYPIELSNFFKSEEESKNNLEKGIKIACDEILKMLN